MSVSVVSMAKLQEAVTAARRMKHALDAHLGVLAAKRDRLSVEGKQIPSRNNFFWYVADSDGLIKTQQDAAFVVESVMVAEDPTAGEKFYEIAIKDANAGRDLTGGFHPIYEDSPVTTSEDTNFVPGALLVPATGRPAFSLWAPNVDDWKTTKASYILPRASVVRVVFRSSGGAGVGPGFDSAVPTVVLSGYKIF